MRRCFLGRVIAALALTMLVIAPFQTSVNAQITNELLEREVAKVEFGKEPGSLLIAVFEPDGSVSYAAAGKHPDGTTASPTDAYRVGSNTKMFTSALVLTLVDEGLVDLDAPATDYITRADVPTGVTVRQLLNHTSGIFNYTDLPNFFGDILDEPDHQWTPEEILELIADQLNEEPGSGYAYSNTNFILLGILIEEVTGKPYHEVLQDRIIGPLGLTSTYLDIYQTGPEPVGAYEKAPGGFAPIEYDYTGYASVAWAAGGLVSTGPDLHTFLTALFNGDIISDDSLAQMIEMGPDAYGLGIMSNTDYPGLFGHEGGIPGYATIVVHAPSTGRTAFWALTNESIDYSPSILAIFEALDKP